MKSVRVISTALSLFLLLGTAAPAYARQGGKQDKSEKQDKGDKQGKSQKQAKGKSKAQAESRQGKQQEQEPAPQARPEQTQQRALQQDQQQQRVQSQQKPQKQQKQNQRQVRVQQQQDRPPGWDKGKKVGWGDGTVPPGQQTRVSQKRQQALIRAQQQRVLVYRRRLDEQQRLAQQYAARLQQQRYMASYRYQQEYLARLRQQRIDLQQARDYNNDPFFYTAPIYRYNRAGSYYQTNEYGANLLRQAVNNGYAQGFQAGQAAQQDRWTSGYRNSYAYQDANYGYDGYYIDQREYNYYFRQGFSRGYDDGYNSRNQFGQSSGGTSGIMGAILSQILNLQSLR
ncbi:MAG TPA: hypothetical protein VLE48_11715 [Terriglobales bacterium]|nr:hypothetical protein [Terriglobales bacterium]